MAGEVGVSPTMLAAAFHAYLDFPIEKGLGEGGALDASKGGEITGADQTHGPWKGTVHCRRWRAGAFRVGEDVEVRESVAHEKRTCGGKVFVCLARR